MMPPPSRQLMTRQGESLQLLEKGVQVHGKEGSAAHWSLFSSAASCGSTGSTVCRPRALVGMHIA